MNLNIVDDLRKKNPAALPRRQPPPPWLGWPWQVGLGPVVATHKGSMTLTHAVFTMLSHFRLFPVYHPFISVYPGRPFIPFIPATWPVNAVFRSPAKTVQG
jgi:hypothetical protein